MMERQHILDWFTDYVNKHLVDQLRFHHLLKGVRVGRGGPDLMSGPRPFFRRTSTADRTGCR